MKDCIEILATQIPRNSYWRQGFKKIVPLYKDLSSNIPIPVTQFDMKSSEDAGLVKFDLLGLKTLTVIKKAVNFIKKRS